MNKIERKDSQLHTRLFAGMIALLALNIPAQAEDGINIGNLKLTPSLRGSYVYDSNVQRDPETRDHLSDTYFTTTLGLVARNSTDALQVEARGWGRLRRYDTFTDKDMEEYGFLLGASAGSRDILTTRLNLRWADLNDFSQEPFFQDIRDAQRISIEMAPDRSEASSRQISAVGLAIGRDLTEEIEFDAGVQYSEVNYDEDLLLDYKTYRAAVELARALTDKSAVLAVGSAGRQESDGFDATAETRAMRLGLKTRATQKVTFKGSAGLREFKLEGLNERRNQRFDYELQADWRASTKVIAFVNAETVIVPASDERRNARQTRRASGGMTYYALPFLNFTLMGSFGRVDYVDPVQVRGEMIDKYVDTVGGQLIARFQPRIKWLSLSLSARYDSNSSNDPNAEYDLWRFSASGTLRY